ncbi:unnamed protein product [Rangifer tarandus platyrhynchus]|uniref:Uncharacterized protein n=1 Tax=Rangifer tarandus platyrhynchus TaxID=3082113 RepID=A0ABN8Y538_RANTA|nr:unnamed protein product [Rangifer tarandus platyrhynchus]
MPEVVKEKMPHLHRGQRHQVQVLRRQHLLQTKAKLILTKLTEELKELQIDLNSMHLAFSERWPVFWNTLE